VVSSQTSPALALHVVVLELELLELGLGVVVMVELLLEEQAPLTQDNPVAQDPVYVPQVAPADPPDVPY